MKPLRYGAVAIAVLAISGCMTIDQKVRPVSQISNDNVCIVENPKVQPGFLDQFKKTLGTNGYKYKILPENSGFKDCNIITIYTANWAWDLALYMAYAKITVYRAGQPLGNAVYDARKAGLNSDKFVRGHEKVDELVSELFPKQSDDGGRKAIGGSVPADGSKSTHLREDTPAKTSRGNVSPLGHAAPLPTNRQLTAAELKSEWPNHTVIMPRAKIHFDLDGTMQGETKNGNSSDVGTYWITNEDQLCLKWERWRSGKTFCLFVKREGSEFVYVKPDGTIARRFSKVPGNPR